MRIRIFLIFLGLCIIGISYTPRALAQNIPPSVDFSRSLSVGDTGNDVSNLQQFLIDKKYLAIPAPTGYYGNLTSIAVAVWQKTIHLPPVGIFGPLSRRAITDSIDSLAVSSAAPVAPATASSSPTDVLYMRDLTIGDAGMDVASLQNFLITKKLLPIAEPTGYFGPLTKAALQGWQLAMQVPDTGYFGPLTRESLENTSDSSGTESSFVNTSGETFVPITPSTSPIISEVIATATPTAIPAPVAFIPSGGGGGGGGGGSPPPPPAPVIIPPVVSTSTTTSSVSTTTQSNSATSTTTHATTTPPTSSPGTTHSTTPSTTQSSPATTTTTTTTAAPSTPSPTLSSGFGVSVGDSMLGLSSTTLNAELDSMVKLGTGWIRFDIEWQNVQPNDSKDFNWSDIDTFVAAVNAHHIKILAILDFAPKWAESSDCPAGTPHCPPADPNAFAAFAKAVVQRYSPQGISKWEIWNEPNNAGFWGPATDCAAYTTLLKDTYTAIKQADPNAGVISAGLAPEATDGTNMSPTDFLSCIYANGGKGYFDAVGDHPYTFPQLPSAQVPHAWEQMSVTLPSLRSIMVANGDGNKRIWITEFGAPTDGPDPHWYVSEAEQAQMVADALNQYKTYSWAGPMFWYTLKDGGTSTTTNENFFGLEHTDGSPKPAYTTLQSMIPAITAIKP